MLIFQRKFNKFIDFSIFRAAGDVYRSINIANKDEVAIKRMLLDKQQRKDMIISEIEGLF